MLRRLGLAALIGAGAALIAPGAAAQRTAPGAAAAGKPVAPFEIEYDLSAAPTLGVPLEIALAVRPRAPVDAIELTLSADDGLSLDASDELLTAPAASPDSPAEWRIAVLPVSEGPQRLRVYAEASVDGERQGRSIVISLRVGASTDTASRAKTASPAKGEAAPAAVEPGPHSERASDSERVIRLPSTSPR